MKKRNSYQLTRLKNELRKRALTEDDEDKRKDYWRLYYQALNAEREVREMVIEAEMRRLLDIMRAEGLLDNVLDDDDVPEESPLPDDTIDDDDIPPRQKGLWD